MDKEMWFIYSMPYSLVINTDELFSFAITCMGHYARGNKPSTA